MREISYGRVSHPDILPSGAAAVVDPTAMNDLVDRLQNGDPTVGWEGDPRLSVGFHRGTQRWEIWRLEVDGKYRCVGRSKSGFPFPPDVVRNLVARDARRGYDVVADVDAHNAKVEKQADYDMAEKFGPAHERLWWALRKDDRTGAGL